MIDLDALEYTYDMAGQIAYTAIIDWKHGNTKKLSKNFRSHKVQSSLAETLGVPFFQVVTYLDATLWPVPMYFVKPVCSLAKKALPDPTWMSPKAYAQFQHRIRGLTPYAHELNGLSDAKEMYPLPEFDY